MITTTPQDHEAFYRELTLRNSGFIGEREQRRLREATILVAGCGSTGGSMIELLVRTGAEKLILADNGRYELNNANRQNMTIHDPGRSMVDVFSEQLRRINPWLSLDTHPEGITPDNADPIVAGADVVIDAVDVTNRAGLEIKFLLHRICHEQRKPVICGYDMAAAQYIPVFDYRHPDIEVLDGALSAGQVASLEPLQACTLLIPPEYIPVEMFEELERHEQGKDFTSQLGMAAGLFGTIATALVLDIVNDKPVKPAVYLDLWSLIRLNGGGDQIRENRRSEGQKALRNWQNKPGQTDLSFVQRSIEEYEVPELPELEYFSPRIIDERAGLITYALPHTEIHAALARRLLRFAFVHYAQVGFINPETAALNQWHAEPDTSLHPEDVHILVVTADEYRLLGYSTLKAPIARGLKFSDPNRPWFSVEGAFGRDLYDEVPQLQHLPVESVREVGRVTKAGTEDPALSARVGLRLLSAYRKLIADPRSGINAIVGDGEAKVTLRNLGLFGFNPVILPLRPAVISDDHLFAPRYHGREVYPFWFPVSGMDHERADNADALIELEDAALLTRLGSEKNNTRISPGG